MTGRVEFKEGKRSNFKLDLLKLKKEKLQKVGQWNPFSGINITDPNAFYETNTNNITLVVMTREVNETKPEIISVLIIIIIILNLFQERPYVMVRNDKNLTGNARFEGFCIDLLRWISGQVGFNYEIRLVPDHKYGVLDQETKQWNGIVRELMDKVCAAQKNFYTLPFPSLF